MARGNQPGTVYSPERCESQRLGALKRWERYRSNPPVEKWIQRFWSHVTKAGPDECWEHDASFGQMSWGGRLQYVARISWFIHYGVWPDFNVLHRCDNPPCVNPNHLFLGTQSENMLDMWDKGRARPKGQAPRGRNR